MNALRVGTVLVALAGLVGVLYLLSPGEEAKASLPEVDNAGLIKVITGHHARNLKLMAMKELSEQEGGIAELEKIAKGRDQVMAVYATTFLGKAKSGDAKLALKRLLENNRLGIEARKGAMTAIAIHFGTASDYSYLEGRAEEDGKLKAYCEWLERKVRR